jgi:hypothetical protein
LLGRGVGDTHVTDVPWVPRSRSHETTYPEDVADPAEIAERARIPIERPSVVGAILGTAVAARLLRRSKMSPGARELAAAGVLAVVLAPDRRVDDERARRADRLDRPIGLGDALESVGLSQPAGGMCSRWMILARTP